MHQETSTLKRASPTEDTVPQYPFKRVKSLEAEGPAQEREQPSDTKIEGSDQLKESPFVSSERKLHRPDVFPHRRKQSEDSNISESEESGSDIPTSPEYRNSSASEDSDDTDLMFSQSSKRAKKAALNPSLKDARPPRQRTKNAKAKQARGRKRKNSDKSVSEPSDLDYESDEEFSIPKGERNELLNNLTRERAKRLLEAVELPQGHDLSPDEQRTAHQLLTRGCRPTIHRHWEKDFSTLPESLFFSGKDDDFRRTESNFVLENDKGSEFYAIRAFQELLKTCGNVRDYCNVLETCPSVYIKRSIEKYLRWALADARIRVQSGTIPVYAIHCKKEKEASKDAFDKVARRLLKLSDVWRSQLSASQREGVWPALIGLVVCGPVLSAITLDTNPKPQTSTEGIKFLGHFDLSDFDNDVWNTLAVAIAVMHIKRTMKKLAQAYDLPFVAPMFDESSMGGFPDPDL